MRPPEWGAIGPDSDFSRYAEVPEPEIIEVTIERPVPVFTHTKQQQTGSQRIKGPGVSYFLNSQEPADL